MTTLFDISKPSIYSYSTREFPFKETIEKILNTTNLNLIHLVNNNNNEILKRENDQSTYWHKTFYNNYSNEFHDLYKKFIQKVLKPGFAWNRMVYQNKPSFRVHLVKNIAVGEWHRDRTYSHNVNEINIWLPFTDAYDTNTIWTESQEGLEDFMPYDVKYGEFLIFNGANLLHGNKMNETNDTRVSIDFRVINHSIYKEAEGAAINTNLKFKIGEYYSLM